jgi:hypothetical protein
MKNRNHPKMAGEVAKVRQRFEEWRAQHPGRKSLPQELWSAAVELARRYGVNRVAQALRLSYYALQEHLKGSGAREPDPARDAGRFIELLPWSAAVGECHVELENGQGQKMRIQLKGAATRELSTLTQLFWRSHDPDCSSDAHSGGGRAGGLPQWH